MRIGIPSETKTLEGRVALVPAAAADLVRRGHEVFIQAGAGEKSGFSDEAYAKVGIKIVPDAAALYEAGELIVKVKEPVAGDLALLKKHHLLFCYLHLAAEPALTKSLLDIGLTGVAFESVEEDGGLPLLLPMSVIAGRIATQMGTTLLHRPQGGKGKLLGGMASTPRGKVVVLGAGAAGGNAAALAAAAGANVVVFDKRQDRLAEMMAMGPNVTALYAYESSVAGRGRNRRYRRRRRADPQRQGPARRHRSDGQDDGEGQCAGRYLDRSGRLLRNLPRNDLERADLRRAWRDAFLRYQYARPPSRRPPRWPFLRRSCRMCSVWLPARNGVSSSR